MKDLEKYKKRQNLWEMLAIIPLIFSLIYFLNDGVGKVLSIISSISILFLLICFIMLCYYEIKIRKIKKKLKQEGTFEDNHKDLFN